jgi:cell division protein ZapA (FtsZ GTPase activity inhibitor)
MEMETQEILGSLGDSVGRLNAAASLLERTVAWLEARESAISGDVQKVVAAVENAGESSQTEAELERKLQAAEQEIAELRAAAIQPMQRRKTQAGESTQLLAKHGSGTEQIESATLDAALTGLSLEQRIAVKSRPLRAGALI